MSQPVGDPDIILAIRDGDETELRVKGSRFFAQAFSVESESDAAAHLAVLRKRYHDATHHCSALRMGPPEDVVERCDDDGEPSGTAGLPILGAIQREEVLGAFVVVTRYYGGTKLGTGGLVRAYGESARMALEAAPLRRIWREEPMEVSCAYADLGSVEAVLARAGEILRVTDRNFDAEPSFSLSVRRSKVDGLRATLVEETAGRAVVSVG